MRPLGQKKNPIKIKSLRDYHAGAEAIRKWKQSSPLALAATFSSGRGVPPRR
ncbi:hypothetical protein SH528x_005459 [Novipirellula sp. SH528]|uniref:hypothetical protein n=1 Tax=Novipirellula sp. SH528 TaxID=3454466 RepID=UPI003FA16A70